MRQHVVHLYEGKETRQPKQASSPSHSDKSTNSPFVTVLKAKLSGLHRERTSTRCTDFQHAYGVLVVLIVTVIVIVQIYRTRRSHENDLTLAYERKKQKQNRCRVYTHCSCCVEKIPYYIQNEFVHVKLLNTHYPCSRTKSPCTFQYELYGLYRTK